MYVLVAMNCSQLKFKIPPPSFKKRIKKIKTKVQTKDTNTNATKHHGNGIVWLFNLDVYAKSTLQTSDPFKEVHISCTL